MSFFIPALSLLLAIGLPAARSFSNCPTFPEASPCRCRLDFSAVTVDCVGVTDSPSLLAEVQRLKGHTVDTLTLKAMTVDFLPPGLFLGTSVRRLSIEHSNLEKLYPSDSSRPGPFEGLEHSLEEIRVVDTRDLNKWYWPDMSEMTQLKKFEIVRSQIDFIGHVFAEMGGGSLEVITASHSGVYRIHPQAFPELTNMRSADFSFNALPYLVRTMFPNPAPRLEKLNFRNNKLFTLNENMFENMPALHFLDFSENEFKAFEDVPFKPVWNQLDYFYMSKNPFNCDCSLQPLLEKLVSGPRPSQNDLSAVTCELDGEKKSLKDLGSVSLQCY